jgi:hypothetical protein
MKVRFVAATCAAVAGLTVSAAAVPAAASPSAAAHSFRIRLVGIERDGRRTPVDAVIYGLDYIPIYTSGKSVVVPAGPAWIGAGINTTSSSGEVLSTTLVLRKVTISGDRTVTLDARPGRRVTFSLHVSGASDIENSVQACVGGRFVTGAPVAINAPPGGLYEVPVRSGDVVFGYASSWQDSAASLLIAGQRNGGLPARPHFAARLASMTRINLAFLTDTAVGGYSQLELNNNVSCAVQQWYPVSVGDGERLTQYVSAGTWQVTAQGYRADWQTMRRYRAGRSYSDTFGAAIWGPGPAQFTGGYFPLVSADQLYFDPAEPIDDPHQESSVCCDMSSITLSARGRVIKHSDISQLGAEREFSAAVPVASWYTLKAVSWRRVPGLKVPADILSPRVIVAWRFRAAPLPDTDPNSVIAPVSTAQFLAGGLNLQNQAPSLGTTKLTMTLSWPAAADFQILHRHKLKTVRLQVSYNGGVTWQLVSLVHSGRSWLASVHDPASGYVSLRSTVIDTAGNSTVETIYRAYRVG